MIPRRLSLAAPLVALSLLAACSTGDESSSAAGSTAATVTTVLAISDDGATVATGSADGETVAVAGQAGTDTSGIDRHDSEDDAEWEASDAMQIDLGDGSVTITDPGTYVLTGTLADGQVVVNSEAEGKVRLVLDNASITSSTGPAILVQAADELVIVLPEGTASAVADGSDYTLTETGAAAISSAADVTITGTGSLTIVGNRNDGINTSDGLVLSGGTVSVSAVDDGVRGKDYVVVDGATVEVAAGDHGVKADNADEAGSGQIAVVSGSLTVAAGGDGLHAVSTVHLLGGSVNVTDSYEAVEAAAITFGGGTASLVSSDDAVNGSSLAINGGEISVDARGDGLDINGTITMTGGTVVVTGPTEQMNGPIDYDGTFDISGGTIVATGSAGMAMAPSQTSAQKSLLATFSTQAAGSTVEVRAADGTVILTLTPSRAFESIAVSTPAISEGVTYEIVVNGTVVASTNSDEAVSQTGPGGGPGGGRPPQP